MKPFTIKQFYFSHHALLLTYGNVKFLIKFGRIPHPRFKRKERNWGKTGDRDDGGRKIKRIDN
jgi:hypothetical protein